MMLLAVEKGMTAPEIATVVRKDAQTVRRWMKRFIAEGIEGLKNAPRPSAPSKVTDAYVEKLLGIVRRRPRSLGLAYSTWNLQRLADYKAEETSIRVGLETVRLHLAK